MADEDDSLSSDFENGMLAGFVDGVIARIDRQDKLIRAYRVLVACYDNLLCGVDKTAVESERLIGLEAARQIVAELEN